MRSLSQRQWQALGGVASRTWGPSFAPPHRAQLRRQSEEGRGLRRLDCPSFPGASSQERHGRPIGDPPVLTPLLAAPLSTVSGAGHRRGEWSTRLSISGRAGRLLYAALLLAARGAVPQTQPRTGSGTLLSPAEQRRVVYTVVHLRPCWAAALRSAAPGSARSGPPDSASDWVRYAALPRERSREEWSTQLSISGRAGRLLYAALLLAARGAAPQTQPRTGSGTLLSPAPPPLAQSPVRPPAPHYHPGRSSRSRGRSLLSTLLRAEVV